MYKLILIACLIPGFLMAQTTKSKPKPKPKPQAKPVVKLSTDIPKPADGYVINAKLTNLNDGTIITLADGSNGSILQNVAAKEGRFAFVGKMTNPEFRVIFFDNNQSSRIILFMDNSAVKITGDYKDLAKATVSGSASHNDFSQFNAQTFPFQNLFSEEAPYDSAVFAQSAKVVENFVVSKPSSWITPLAIYRYYQLTDDYNRTEQMLATLPEIIRTNSLSSFISQQVAEDKKSATGYQAPEFTQSDTAGIAVSLSQFRGKYVLLDFWASWCGPCRRENPNVVAAFNSYKSKNFTVLGVSLDKPGDKARWLQAIKDDNLTWTHVSDLQFWQNAVAQQYQVGSIPQNFLIDPEGKVIAKNLRGTKLHRKLAKILH